MKYWLMKSEPEAFSIDDLKAKPESTEHWDGIRNYQARNFMRDDMRVGDKILFYHSNCEEPGVVGIAEVASEAYPDHTAFNPASKYYDPKSKEDKPTWMMVDVKFIDKFPKTVSLREIKTVSGLSDMRLVQKGNRLSIMPVEKSEFDIIVKMAGA
jgi:predicted RNA-binding protein with PUA-like domain